MTSPGLMTGELGNTKLLKLSLGSFKFACTLSGVKCGNHDTEVMPQLLNVGDIDQVHKTMVEMTVISEHEGLSTVCLTGGCFGPPIAAEVVTETMRKRSK